MPLSGHARVNEDLRDGVLSALGFLGEIGLVHGVNEIEGVIVGEKLESVLYALNEVLL